MPNDLINRKIAYAMLSEYYHYRTEQQHEALWDALSRVPSAESGWHVISRRPMTENEWIEWSDLLGYDLVDGDAFIYSNLPDDGEEVIICTHSGFVCTDIYCEDDGGYFDNHDLYEVVAWQPLPEPWKGEVDDND